MPATNRQPSPAHGDEPPLLAPPVIGRPPRPRPPSSPGLGLLATMAATGAGIFLALKLGFIFHDDPQPWPISSPLATAVSAGILAIGIARLLYLLGRAMSRRSARTKPTYPVSEALAARAARVVELASDPARAKYAPLVERGENWSDENIAYFEDTNATVTCPHLQSIESAMRSAGIEAKRYDDSSVTAKCRINLPRLEAIFEITPPVRYSEFWYGDRSDREYAASYVICDEHHSMIHTVHPEDHGAESAPWFPVAHPE